jgi:hypothetical protein
MPEKAEKQKHERKFLSVKLSSLEDLCRYAYNFDFTSESVIYYEANGSYRLALFGEILDDTQLQYYVELKTKPGKMLRYTPPVNGESESATFIDLPEESVPCINIITLDLSAFKTTDKIDEKEITKIKMPSIEDIVKASIGKSAHLESLSHLYAFDYKGERIISGFNLISSISGESNVYYAIVKSSKSTFARYNYNDNRVDVTDRIGDHQFMYTKIINLAEPFAFFKNVK